MYYHRNKNNNLLIWLDFCTGDASRWSATFGTFVTGLGGFLAIVFGFGCLLSSNSAILTSVDNKHLDKLTKKMNITVSAPGVGAISIRIFSGHLVFKIRNILDLVALFPSVLFFFDFQRIIVRCNLGLGSSFPFCCNLYLPRMLILIFRPCSTGSSGRSVHSMFEVRGVKVV
jgi:hypothetical protein